MRGGFRSSGRVCSAFVAALLATAVLSAPSPAGAVSTSVVVSQVYGGGGNGGAPYLNDYVELFNLGSSSVSLAGWSVQYASATGTGNFGANSSQLTPLAGSIAPGQHLLVQEASGGTAGSPLPTPDVTDSTPINLSATGGKVALTTTTASLGCNGGSAPCSPSALALIVDLVGYDGANFFEGPAPAPAGSNTTAVIRSANGCAETDNNGADFTAGAPAPRNAASPLTPCGADAAPAVSSTAPANGATGVPVAANPTVTFTEPVDTAGSWYSISCASSGAHTAAASGGPTTFTLDPDADFALSETCTVTILAAQVTDQDANDPPDAMASNYQWSFTTAAPPTRIHDIQGAAHLSPLAGQPVSGVAGVVTAVRDNGFWMQDPNPDADPDTSEGIFVFTSSAPTVAAGDSLAVAGSVSEFRPGGATGTNLTTTEIVSPSISVLATGSPLPPATVIGLGGRVPPGTVIEDDASGSVETSGVFDPATDGVDFYESLEGMRVQLNDAVAVGPTSAFGEIPVLPDGGAGASVRTARGGIVVRPGDFNPERVILDDVLAAAPAMSVGDSLPGATAGVLDYSFGSFKLEATSFPAVVSGGLTRESTTPAGQDQLAVATMNVENLDPSDGARFDALAAEIVDNLGAPDVVALEEIQDGNGATDNGLTDPTLTMQTLVTAVQDAGGPAYDWRQIDPVNDQDGGEPGGNIRVVFLFRTDRGLAFVDRPGGTSTASTAVTGTGASTQLTFSPGRIDPTNAAFASSRKPLAGEFTYQGHRLFVIANHFNSKGGDQPLFGRFQPPALASETQRVQQAQIVHDFVGDILSADPNANVVVLGDLNDFSFAAPLTTLKGSLLHDLVETLPESERYTYVFEGNSQALDHILLSDNLFDHASFDYDIVHANAEFAVQPTDHDPEVVRLSMPAPTMSAARSPAPGPGGWNDGTVTVSFTCSDPLSAIASCPAPVPLTTEGAGRSVSRTVVTKGGLPLSASVNDISIDLTAPSVAVSGVSDGATYPRASVPAAGCVTQDQPGLSGVATAATLQLTGPGTTNPNGVGSVTATCAGAADVAGNASAPVSATYTVVYGGVSGILAPIAPGGSGVPNRGRVVPVRFALAGDEPLGFDVGGWVLQRLRVSCVDPGQVLQTLPAFVENPSNAFRYDPAADQYLNNASFNDQVAGQCWKVLVTLDSGQAMLSGAFRS